jgi:hypothetical protein
LAKQPETASAFGGLLGGLLLLLSVGGLLLGIFGAFYLDHDRRPTPVQTVQQPTEEPRKLLPETTPAAPTPASESPPDESDHILPDTARALARIEPAAGPDQSSPAPGRVSADAPDEAPAGLPSVTAQPQAEPAEVPPPPAAIPVAAASRAAPGPTLPRPPSGISSRSYTVDYATYAGGHRGYAERLARQLRALGIDASVVDVSAAAGRSLLAVRSTAAADAIAERNAAIAHRKLHISTMIRSTGPLERSVSGAPTSADQEQYRVRYAAFDRRVTAGRLQRRLAAQGLSAGVATDHRPDGRPIYVVRSIGLVDRHAASAMAEQARSLAAVSPEIITHPKAAAQLRPSKRVMPPTIGATAATPAHPGR